MTTDAALGALGTLPWHGAGSEATATPPPRFSLGEGPKTNPGAHGLKKMMTKQNQSSLRILEYPLVI